MTTGRVRFVLLNLAEKLCTLRPTIVDKSFDVLFQTVDAVLHLAIEALCSHQTLYQVTMSHEDFLVFILDSASTLLHAFVFLLI